MAQAPQPKVTTFTGWVSFTHSTDSDDKSPVRLPFLRFPLRRCDQSYSVGKDPSNDIVLPPCAEKTPEIKINVSKDGKIEIVNNSVTPTSASSLEMFGRNWRCAKGMKRFQLPLDLNDYIVLKLGPYVYQFYYAEAPGWTYYNSIGDALKCPKCLTFFADPILFPCGHVVCSACINHLVEEVLDQAQYADVPILQVRCPKCTLLTSIEIVSSRSQSNQLLSTLTKCISEIYKNSKEIKCEFCENSRMVIGSDEYYVCKTCSVMLLCPGCVLDSHRRHEVQLYYEFCVEKWMAFEKASFSAKHTFWKFESDYNNEDAKKSKMCYDQLDYCRFRIASIISALNSLLKPANHSFNQLVKFKAVNSQNDQSIDDSIELFLAEIVTLKNSVQMLFDDISATVNIFERNELDFAMAMCPNFPEEEEGDVLMPVLEHLAVLNV